MIKNKVQEFLNELFGEVRCVKLDNKIWFIAKDIADALKYSETNAMTKKIDDEDQQKIASDKLEGTNNMAREFTIINESGLYQAVLSITKKDLERYKLAKDFKKWITDTVIPAIRKDGAYIQDEEKVSSGEMSEDEFILKAMNILQNKVTRLTQENKELKDENEDMKPKVTKWSQFLDSDSTYSFVDTCKMISTMAEQEESEIKISTSKLTEFLRDEGILCKTKTPDKAKADGKVKKGSYKNLPNKDFENYFDVVTVDAGKFKKVQARVKPNGIEYIYEILKNKQAS